MSEPTLNQKLAIEVNGNVLVEAGAGSGKTRTLVQRCLARVVDPEHAVSLEHILMVTFTEAAAAEMRKRIGEALEKAVAAERDRHADSGGGPRLCWLEEQLALLDTARISTLHSFCLQLIREHFHELGIDPQLAVLDEAQAKVMARQTLDEVLRGHYAGKQPNSQAVQDFITAYGDGGDERIRTLILRIHHYARSRDDAEEWLQAQATIFRSERPEHWQAWLVEGIAEWRAEWIETLSVVPPENEHAHVCLEILRRTPNAGVGLAKGLDDIAAVDQSDWKRRKTKDRPALIRLFEDAMFLRSLIAPEAAGTTDQQSTRDACSTLTPLEEDWSWVRGQMGTLLLLVLEFGESFAKAKREMGSVDFADLEQFALQLLWDGQLHQATNIARQWQAQLELIFVDEYQDINAAQDRIIECLSREGERANRFLVGDVKQSIYRFRLANPHIFQSYAADWRKPEGAGRVIPLSNNFRSHEAILEFVNEVFAGIMQREVGGVDYDDDARLQFGNREGRHHFTRAEDEEAAANGTRVGPRVEFLLRLTESRKAEDSDEEQFSLTTTESEARMLAVRLKRLKESGFKVHDEKLGTFEPVDWKHMAVLLRSPGPRAEAYAKEFARAGVPLEAKRSGFYEATEVADLMGVLTLLDNPVQDIPLLGVLHSPLVGLTVDELATVRLAAKGTYWDALRMFQNNVGICDHAGAAAKLASASARPKVERFLKLFSQWRSIARQGSLATCLETVLDQTCYEEWLRAQPRGEQKLANVRRLCAMARRFDQLQRQGLYRFLRFIEAERDVDAPDDVAPAEGANAVRLMSIHQSKGLEFPVVALAGLGTKFNDQDLRAEILLDEKHGICPHVRPPQRTSSYPSIAHWLAERVGRRELVGEEIRLLYVALTRAQDKLILCGTTAAKRAAEEWVDPDWLHTAAGIAKVGKPMDWLGPMFPKLFQRSDWASALHGHARLCSWEIAENAVCSSEEEDAGPPDEAIPWTLEGISTLCERVDWRYPYVVATQSHAKTSVTELRRRHLAEDEEAGNLMPLRWRSSGRMDSNAVVAKPAVSAAETGNAHHLFLEHLNLSKAADLDSLKQEVERLAGMGVLTNEQAGCLNLSALAAFWIGPLGSAIRRHADRVHREVPFTARFSLEEAGMKAGIVPDEYVVVQGVVDLVVLQSDEIWVLDFKSDAMTEAQIPEKLHTYGRQIVLYSLALERIYKRPVTQRWLHFLTIGKSEPVSHVNSETPCEQAAVPIMQDGQWMLRF